ncbi:MAG: radical SAM protein [Deferribacterales bacterium]
MKVNILPVFIPFLGCFNRCVFCNQNAITGKTIGNVNVIKECEKQIKEYKNFSVHWDEIAYFGGSFTCIKKELRYRLYNLAEKYQFKNIRISTRPDCIDEEIINELKVYNVKTVELGVQSTSEKVLKLNGRSYTQKDIYKSFNLLKNRFKTSLQLMTGMYGETINDLFNTIVDAKNISPDYARIYPTVVLKGSTLAKLMKEKIFIPDNKETILAKTALLYSYLTSYGIKVIRIGLPESLNLNNNIEGGFYHPAIGDIVKTISIAAYILKYDSIPFIASGFKKLLLKNFYDKKLSEIDVDTFYKKITGEDIENNWWYFKRASDIISQEL